MRKLVTLLTLAIMSISSICYAFEQPDPNRWLWLGSDDKMGIWLDMQSFKIEKIRKSIGHDGHNSANLWIQFYKSNEDQHAMQNFICDFDCNSISSASVVVYNSNNEVVDSFTPMYTEFHTVVPGSLGEYLYIMAEQIKEKKEENNK